MKLKKKYLFIGIILIIFAGCSTTKIASEDEVKIANPASMHCTENGGELKIITDENETQSGICHFEDGESCEEWAFFNGECPITEEEKEGPRMCTMEYAPVCGVDGKTYSNECMAGEVEIVSGGEC